MDSFQPQAGAHVKIGHEEGDFNLRGIILFVIILILSAILTMLAAVGLLKLFEWMEVSYFDKKPTAVQQQLSDQRGGEPMKKTGGVKPQPDWYSRSVDEQTIQRTFATPRLQYDDTADMENFLNIENARLNSTGKDADGSIHIPIDQAIDMLANKGLPPVNGTFVPGPALGDLEAVANAAQRRVNEANKQGPQPPKSNK